MSVVLKKGVMRFRNKNSNYSEPVNVVSEKKTSDMIQDVTNAGTKQISSIEAKGASTRESIPDDYSALTKQAAELKGDLDGLDTLLKDKEIVSEYLFTNDMVDGYVRADGTFNTNSSWNRTDYLRVGNHFLISMSNANTLFTSTGYNIAFFDVNKNLISGQVFSSDGNINDFIDTPNGTYYVIISNPKANNCSTDFVKTSCVKNKDYILVAKSNGDFTTVTEAVANAISGDIIFVKNGNYENEHIKGWGKEIAIIGESKLGVVISCNDSTYDNPTIEFSTGVLRNLTFERLNVDSSGYTLHCEDDFQYGKTLVVENCIFKSPKTNSVGMGMRGNSKIIFKDCEFYNTENQGSCVYIHDANENPYVGTYDLDFDNCYFSNLGNYIISFQSQEKTGSLINFGFSNCRFYGNGSSSLPYIYTSNHYGGTSSDNKDFQGLINWRLKKTSIGNNLTALNVLPTYTGIATN